jgi:chromosome segregation ATPase
MAGIVINMIFELSSYIKTAGRKSERIEKDRRDLTQLQVKLKTLQEKFSEAEKKMNQASSAYRELLISDSGTDSSFFRKYPHYSEYKQLVTEYELIINDEKYDDDIYESYRNDELALESLENEYRTTASELADKLARLGNTKAAQRLVERKRSKLESDYSNRRQALVRKLERHKQQYDSYKREIRKKLKKYKDYIQKAESDKSDITNDLTRKKFMLEKKFIDSKNEYNRIRERIDAVESEINLLKKDIDYLYDRQNSDFTAKARMVLIHIGLFVFLFVVNTAGWLLIMKKTVLKCDMCSAVFDVDIPGVKNLDKTEKQSN